MRRHQPRNSGVRPLGEPRMLGVVLALALVVFALPAGNALAAYTFSGGGTNTGTATGDAAVTTLYLEADFGLIYHSTDGVVFSPDWGGGLTIAASSANTINVAVSTADGSVLILGGVLNPASALQAAINVVAPSNTADAVTIDDTLSSTTTTYMINTEPGSITAPGINYNQGASLAFQGGITLKGGTGNDTYNVLSVCCNTTHHEPISLVGNVGNDTFNIGNSGSLADIFRDVFVTDLGGGASVTVDDSADATGRTVTISASQVTGASGGAINFGAGVTSLTYNGGTGADTFLVTPNATIPLFVNGGLPTTAPGDTMTVDLTGVTNPLKTPASAGSGQVTFGNRAAVNYSGLECLTPTTAAAGGPQSICPLGTTTALGGNTPIFGTGQWSVVSGGTGTFNPNDTTPNATFTHASGAGPVTVRWTISSLLCTASTADVAVTIKPTPATPVATNGGGYFPGQTIHLFASTVPTATYYWTGPLGFISTDQNPTIPNATLAMTGTYSVIATVDGCDSAAGTTQVNVTPPIPTLSLLGLIALLGAVGAFGFLLLRRRVLG